MTEMFVAPDPTVTKERIATQTLVRWLSSWYEVQYQLAQVISKGLDKEGGQGSRRPSPRQQLLPSSTEWAVSDASGAISTATSI